MNKKQPYRMPVGTELHVPSSTRKGWKLVSYVTDDMICIEAPDGKQIQIDKKNVTLRMSNFPRRKGKLLTILILIMLSSCATPRIITPKVARVVPCGTGYDVYVWYVDSYLIRHFDNLPDSIRKGKRITLHPGYDSTGHLFRRQK